MKTILRFAFAAVVLSLGVQQALAQPVTGCPAGQVMQSSDPSGKRITCVALPDVSGLTESDIVGKWAVTGSTDCLQSSNGFSSQTYSPNIPLAGAGSTTVSRLGGTFIGTRTFYAGGMGRSVGTTHSMTFPALNYFSTGPTTFATSPGFVGAASVATLDAAFTWTIKSDGTLLVDDDNSIAQPLIAPPSMLGQSVTIENVPPYAGYISKDKRTIVLTHNDMAIETSVRRDASGNQLGRTPRFCARSRVLTRLP